MYEMYVNYVSPASKSSTKKSYSSKTYKSNVHNWYLHISLNLQICITVFLEASTKAPFFKAVLSTYNSVNMLYSLACKVQQTF